MGGRLLIAEKVFPREGYYSIYINRGILINNRYFSLNAVSRRIIIEFNKLKVNILIKELSERKLKKVRL
jgi:hypothetical protein